MKTIHITLLKKTLIFTLLLSVISCSDDFLDVTPRGKSIATSLQDYDNLFNGLLNNNITLSRHFVARSFETCAIEPYFSNSFNYGEASPTRNNFTWEPNILEGDNVSSFMDFYFRQIYLYNKIVNEVLDASNGTEAEKNSVMAQARAARALMYFNLVNIYGKPYNSASAATDLGVPIVTKADITQTDFVRATVQEVYDFIIEDLNIAMPLLPKGLSQRNRMCNGSAMLLLAKIHVFMGNFSAAIPLLDGALDDFQLGSREVTLFDYSVASQPGQPLYGGLFGVPNIRPINHLESIFHQVTFHPNFLTGSSLLISPEISALYGSSDYRLNTFATRKPSPFAAEEFVVPGVYKKFIPLFSNTGLTLAEVYLFRAECKARTNDLSGAIEDLEFLRMHRIDIADASVPQGLSQDELIKFTMDERTREFASAGTHLWQDMRRLWNDPLFQDRKPYVHTLYNEDGSVKETYTLDEKRLVIRFTDKVMRENPRMENNPL